MTGSAFVGELFFGKHILPFEGKHFVFIIFSIQIKFLDFYSLIFLVEKLGS